MTLSQDALDSARGAYANVYDGTFGSGDKALAAAIEAYVRAEALAELARMDADLIFEPTTSQPTPAAAEGEAARRYPKAYDPERPEPWVATYLREAFVAGASWQREQPALSPDVLAFAKRIVTIGVFEGGSLDGGDIQELAEQFGIIVETKYDPAVHGPSGVAEPGDSWFVLSPSLAAPALSPSEREECARVLEPFIQAHLRREGVMASDIQNAAAVAVRLRSPAPREDNRVCRICDGGPGNNSQCSCGYKAYEPPALPAQEEALTVPRKWLEKLKQTAMEGEASDACDALEAEIDCALAYAPPAAAPSEEEPWSKETLEWDADIAEWKRRREGRLAELVADVKKIRADLADFDGDRRGHRHALDEAEKALMEYLLAKDGETL